MRSSQDGFALQINLTQTERAEGSENMVILSHVFLPYFVFTNFIELQTKENSGGQDIHLGILNLSLL